MLVWRLINCRNRGKVVLPTSIPYETLSVHHNSIHVYYFYDAKYSILESKSRQKEVSAVVYFKTYVLNKVSQDDCFVRGKTLHPQGFFLPWSWPCICLMIPSCSLCVTCALSVHLVPKRLDSEDMDMYMYMHLSRFPQKDIYISVGGAEQFPYWGKWIPI